MADGSIKNIEDVQVGDEVITHKNRSRKVITTQITPYNGKLIELQLSNSLKLKVTPEHPFYCLSQINTDISGKRFGKLNIDQRIKATHERIHAQWQQMSGSITSSM